ncbi:hypothetical protein [Paraglaciecola sp. 20A4]|nr:hypothetical protein [Paraglaciecola sp. 20A4]
MTRTKSSTNRFADHLRQLQLSMERSYQRSESVSLSAKNWLQKLKRNN